MTKAGFFVTGTDTAVGKTLFSSELLRAASRARLRCAGMKPVASGGERSPQGLRNDDAMALWQASNTQAPYVTMNPYCFEPAIAPHIAAREAGVTIDLDHVAQCAHALQEQCDWLVVEGVGGWHVPLGRGLTVADMAQRLSLPVILVVGIRLGCLNHAVLSWQAIQRTELPFAGWVGSQIDPGMAKIDENVAALEELIGEPALCVLPWKPSAETLQQQLDATVEALQRRQ